MLAPGAPFPNPTVLAPERLGALASYGILDTGPEQGFDDIVAIAVETCAAPFALVSFVAADRQWFKAKIGVARCETPIDQSVCAHALEEREALVIPDLLLDPRTRDNPLATADPFLRFYAGVVLRSPEGQPLGTLCVLDVEPRPEGLSDVQMRVLKALGRQVMTLLALRKAAAELAERELTQRLAVDATRAGVFDYDLLTGRLDWDARTRELFGVTSKAPVSYEATFLPGVHADDRAATDAAVRGALDPAGSGLFDEEYRVVAADDGAVRWLAARGQAVAVGGRTTRFVGTVRDVTARRTADARVAASLERYALVGAVTKDVIWDWDLVTDHVLWNEALETLFGHRMADVDPTPGWWLEHIHPEDRADTHEDIRRVIDGSERQWSHEYRFLRADGAYVDVFDRGGVIRDPAGAPLRMIGAMFDITARKAEEERQRLLNHELGHRMKNLMTMVQAVASQTMRGASSMAEAGEMLSGRLVALGRAHDIVLGGSAQSAQLSSIVAEAVGPHLDRPGRLAASGPEISVGSSAALPLMLMLHELATNAAKYGALSSDAGGVGVEWRLTGGAGAETLHFEWTEYGGPAVSPPTRRGFGSRLIERGLAGQIGASARLDYPSTGVTCVFEAPLARLEDDPVGAEIGRSSRPDAGRERRQGLG